MSSSTTGEDLPATRAKPFRRRQQKSRFADLSEFTDEYREGLRQIIDAKIAGEEIVAPVTAAPAPVVNLMDALKKSLNAVSATTKRPAKGAAGAVSSETETRVV
jgi:non-homologous end joining protein Ku